MNELETKLVAALRSGDYHQIQGCLHDGEGYCCLGVACRVAGVEPVEPWNAHWQFDGKSYALPDSVRETLGWTSEYGKLVQPVLVGENTCTTLAKMNDVAASFEDIAEQIANGNVAKEDA